MITTDSITALLHRYATNIFDSHKKISDENLQIILESGRLAPSSFGLEPWKFIVVTNPELRAQLRAAGYDQPKITDASHLIVIAQRTDGNTLVSELIERTATTQGVAKENLAGLEQMVRGTMDSRDESTRNTWLKAQTYIALGIMIETASLLDIDTGPMEGFDPTKVDEILGLSAKNLHATTMLAIGYRGEDPAALRPKVRRAYQDVVEII
jgi:nitroreductase